MVISKISYQYKLAHFKSNMGHDATSDVRNSSTFSRRKPKKRRMRKHFKGCSERMHKLKGCSTRPWQNPFLPRQLLQPHIHHSRLKSIPKCMLAHYEEHQLSIQKTTSTHQDRQPTHVTSARFEQSQRTTYFT